LAGHLKATNSGGLAYCEHNNPLGHLKATTSGGLAHGEHNNQLGHLDKLPVAG
jgi:hypothetical protein